jgi:hypothetical protein
MLRTAVMVLSALCVSGCATSYQRLTAFTYTGGYSDSDLGKNVYRVEFSANGATTRETAQTFWLWRCAELTLEKGFDGFEILSNINLVRAESDTGDEDSAVSFRHAAYVPIYVPSNESNKPYLLGDIHMILGPVVGTPPKIFDARKLKQALEPFVAPAIKSTGQNVKPHIHEYLLPEGKLSATAT